MKLRKKLLILLLVILFTLLQSTVLNYIRIFKVKPDILLILIIFFSLKLGRIYGLIVGALCGLLNEATSGIPSGVAVLVYSFGGLLLGHIGKWVYNQKLLGQLCITFVFSFTIYLSLFFLSQTFNASLSLFAILVSTILPVSLYTAAISPFLFRFLKIALNIK
ncbi:MAG: rod shape-determining protein MreD [Candidatus Omnitrophica bacterium]|nr:rod shape-determining protein MreD [Candidatus Omnitrophota bacterium]